MTFPRHVGQVPIHYDMKNTGRLIELASQVRNMSHAISPRPTRRSIRSATGSSGTSFAYSPAKLSAPSIGAGGTLSASATITNTGECAGEEVVQLYVRDLVGWVTRPVQELKGSEKIMLEPGESCTVSFTVRPADFAFTRADMSPGGSRASSACGLPHARAPMRARPSPSG